MEAQTIQNVRIPSVKDWALILFITSIPLIGFIMLLVWAFSDDTEIIKKNYAKGSLLLMILILIIMFVSMFMLGGMAVMANMFNS